MRWAEPIALRDCNPSASMVLRVCRAAAEAWTGSILISWVPAGPMSWLG